MPKRKTKENPAEQLEDFKRLAREIGADADKDADEVMRRLASRSAERARRPESKSLFATPIALWIGERQAGTALEITNCDLKMVVYPTQPQPVRPSRWPDLRNSMQGS